MKNPNKKGVSRFVLIGSVLLLTLSTALVVSGCSTDASTNNTVNTNTTTNANKNTSSTTSTGGYIGSIDTSNQYAHGTHHATVTVEGYDPFTITLDADNAPISVWNFCTLANKGYYDGKTFYRFQDGFCMQGGTNGNTASGSDSTLTPIKGEFSSNSVDNALADDFKKGVVAMARTSSVNSATSTFFVTLASGSSVSSSLNGSYAAFGTIDDAGMEIVDKIVADHVSYTTDSMGMVSDEANQAKITSIVITD